MKFTRRGLSDEIPTGSMADITFLLIIFFMVTSTFAATRGLDFALPKDDKNPPVVEKEDSVLISIRPGGSLEVDGRPMQLSGIQEYLKRHLEPNPVKPVIIRPEPNAAYGDMVSVYDTLRQFRLVDRKLVQRDEVPHLSEEQWEEARTVNVSIPTQREIDQFWY